MCVDITTSPVAISDNVDHDDPNGIAITTSPLAMDNVTNDDPNGIVLCIMRIHVSFI